MKTLRVMDSTGDTVIEFDETAAMKSAAHVEAEALFERMMAGGGAVFAVCKSGQADTRVTDFKDLAADNVVVPRIVGG